MYWCRYSVDMDRVFNRKTILGISLWIGLNLGVVWFASTMRSVVVDSWKKGPLIDPAAPYAPENAQLYVMWIALWVFNTYVVGLLFSMRLQGWKRTLSPVAILLLSILTAEIGMQGYLKSNQTTHFRPHPTLHWMCRPNLQSFVSSSDGIVLNTNQHGMREAPTEYSKSKDEYRIIVLGDSSNFGQGVSGTEMWSSQLADILSAASTKRVTVLNAACPGWTTHQGVEVMEAYGWRFEPDMVIAGFNNDAGPDFMTDRERVSTSHTIRQLQSVLYQSEVFVITREALLAWIRKLSPTAQNAYNTRLAGEKAKYGKLDKNEELPLVARVPLSEMEENLLRLQKESAARSARFVWINMPINRKEIDLVGRYVNWEYRSRMVDFTVENNIPYVGVDEYWQRSREPDLHILGHVFHPNADGHRRMAEQIAHQIAEGKVMNIDVDTAQLVITGPPPASTPETLRLGWSSKTPIHAHLGIALEQHPELVQKFGLEIEWVSYASGKDQGRDLAEGKLDAWFSCSVPAIHMLDSRRDAKVVATLGELGNISLLQKQGATLTNVAFTEGSTPHHVFKTKSKGASIKTHNVSTSKLLSALLDDSVDGIATWDPWASEWTLENELTSTWSEPFHSVLIVGEMWALGDLEDPRVPRLMGLLNSLIEEIRRNPEPIDEAVAELGDWSVETVRSIRESNSVFSKKYSTRLNPTVVSELKAAHRFVHPNFGGLYAMAPEWHDGLPKVQP